MSDELSTKPYLIRAIYEWCTDSGYTPYLAVQVDETTTVPRDYVKNGEIVLNISALATSKLVLGNEFVEFTARFGGAARSVSVPVLNVSAIYARETGHGMAFEVNKTEGQGHDAPPALPAPQKEPGADLRPERPVLSAVESPSAQTDSPEPPDDGPNKGKPRLTIVK